MNKKFTKIICIIDESGSMAELKNSTVSGYNDFLLSQSKLEEPTKVTTVFFNTEVRVVKENVNLEQAFITKRDYNPGGMTALLDAVGEMIDLESERSKIVPCSTKTIVVIITDGYENASCTYSYDDVKRLISLRQELNNWNFIFLGANIDVAKVSKDIGIDPINAYEFKASAEGVEEMYCCLAAQVSNIREK